MLGVSLSFYKNNLNKVPVHLNDCPINSFSIERALTKEGHDYILENLDPDKPIEDHVSRLDLRMFERNFEQLCKIRLSSFFMMSQSVRDLFEKDLNYRLIEKITSSMWRWGHKRAKWNEIVTAYDAIRSFNLNKPGFSVRLDYTTSVNECGYSEYTRTFLDGVFAYLVYYKGQHVMTLGFSIVAGRKVFVQQVQLKKPHGNRWLFKLPPNYIEYVLDCFTKAFPKYRLHVVEGRSIAQKYVDTYERGLKRAKEMIERYEKTPDRVSSYIKDRDYCTERLAHIKNDFDRITQRYNNTGSFKRVGKVLSVNSLPHYRIDKQAAV